MAEDKKDQKSIPIHKKPKTDKQKEKERERRRKRRQRKKVKIGEDLSLFLSSKDEGVKSKGDFDAGGVDFEQNDLEHQEPNYPVNVPVEDINLLTSKDKNTDKFKKKTKISNKIDQDITKSELTKETLKNDQSDDSEDHSLDLPQIPVIPDQNLPDKEDDIEVDHQEDKVFSDQSLDDQSKLNGLEVPKLGAKELNENADIGGNIPLKSDAVEMNPSLDEVSNDTDKNMNMAEDEKLVESEVSKGSEESDKDDINEIGDLGAKNQEADLSVTDEKKNEGHNFNEDEVLSLESKEDDGQQEDSILTNNDGIDDDDIEVNTHLDGESDTDLEPSKNIFEETPVYESQKLDNDETMDGANEVESINNEENEKLNRVDEDDSEGNTNNQEEVERIRQSLINNNDIPVLEEENDGEWIIGKLIKSIVSVVVIIILAIGAFWVGSKIHILDFVKGVFNGKKVELIEGDDQNVTIDINMQKQLGFYGSKIFSRNLGDIRDLGYNVFFVAHYFGKLMDPVFYGETGITAALYYGYGQDSQYFENKFIYYVKLLGRIKEANKVDVNALLSGKVDREATLNAYLNELKAVFEEGNAMRKEINVQVDDFQISLASLNEDHDRYQNDFFVALNANLAEKSNELMKQFVLNSQKQVELKAKMSGMARLSQDYTDNLLKMQARIVGVEQNMDALISGVRFTEIPGSNLNLID